MSVDSFHPADPFFPPTEPAPLKPLPDAASAAPAAPVRAEPEEQRATVVYARVRNFAATCQTMAGDELTNFVNDVRRMLQGAALELGGEIAQRKPDSILCVFSHRPEDTVPSHARRALHAAVLTVNACVQIADRIAARPQSAGLAPLSIAIGAHLGPAEVTPRAGRRGMVHAVGEAVEIARLLETAAAERHWSIAASSGTRQAAGTRVDSGRSGTLGLPEETVLEMVEIAGLVPRPGSTTPESHYANLRQALERNQQLLIEQ